MLVDSHSGTEHGEVTKRQNARMNNKAAGSGTQPAATFGELRKQAREDLAKSLEGRRKRDDGKPASKKDAEALADCLIAEAEKEIKEKAKADGINVTDATKVQLPGGCCPAGCEIWLSKQKRVRAADLELGARIQADRARLAVTRLDRCRSVMVKLSFDGWRVELAPFDRVRLQGGDYVRADALRSGERVETADGPAQILAAELGERLKVVYAFSFARNAACRIGARGLWVLIRHAGVPKLRTEKLVPFRAGIRRAPKTRKDHKEG